MQVVYIAGPYTADNDVEIAFNIIKARDVAKKYWRLGYAVVCPHMNSSNFHTDIDPTIFLPAYLEILKRCDILILMENWNKSVGAIAEKACAEVNGIEIRYE